MKQWRGSWRTLPCCVPWPWAHSEPGFLKGLLALATWSQGIICLDPFSQRNALGPTSHFSI